MGRRTLKYVCTRLTLNVVVIRHCSIEIFPSRLDSPIEDIKNVEKILGAKTNPSDENAHVWI